MDLPLLGIGTWGGEWGRAERPPDTPERHERLVQTIVQAVLAGVRHIDTAETYGDGYAEEIIGEALVRLRKKGITREMLFLTTKVSGDHQGTDDFIERTKRSLERLGTDHVDLLLIHWYPRDLEASIAALDWCKDQGIAKNIGVSNFSKEQLEKAQGLTKNKLTANQVEYNLERRNTGRYTENVEQELLPYCDAHDVAVIAYKPLALGKLAEHDERTMAIAQKHQATNAQIALAWLLNKGVAVVFRTSNTGHLEENLRAARITLTPQEIAQLEQPATTR